MEVMHCSKNINIQNCLVLMMDPSSLVLSTLAAVFHGLGHNFASHLAVWDILLTTQAGAVSKPGFSAKCWAPSVAVGTIAGCCPVIRTLTSAADCGPTWDLQRFVWLQLPNRRLACLLTLNRNIRKMVLVERQSVRTILYNNNFLSKRLKLQS